MATPRENKPPAGPRVSPVRTIISLLLLLTVGVVCGIELRAGLGQYLTGKAFGAKSEEGAFTEVTLSEAKSMVSMFPTETVHRSTPSETVIKFEWFSLLRPLMGEASPQMFVTAGGGDDPLAMTFHTEADDEATAPVSATDGGGGPPDGMGKGPIGMGGMGMGMGMGMRPGGGGPGGPPADGPGPSGKGRPELEADSTETPAPDTTPGAEGAAPIIDPPATDPPATDPPATDPPAASEPGGAPPQ